MSNDPMALAKFDVWPDDGSAKVPMRLILTYSAHQAAQTYVEANHDLMGHPAETRVCVRRADDPEKVSTFTVSVRMVPEARATMVAVGDVQ